MLRRSIESTIGSGHSDANDPQQEFFREAVRVAAFSTKPSRLLSNFVFEEIEDAIAFRDGWRKGWSVYQVRFATSPAEVHRVCYTAWDHDHPNHTYQAHVFWGCPPVYSSATELFAAEDLIVMVEVNSAQTTP